MCIRDRLDTLKVYFEQLPKIAEAVAKGYMNVDSIKMFGGDSSKLAGDIMTTVTPVSYTHLADFYTGVPDSQLKALCNYLMHTYGIDPKHHVIAANEGNCTALAAGYHLATGKVPVVYMQNSGEGNIINPVASLLNDKVYAIPMIFVIGWRGEPGIHDEPQHLSLIHICG